MRVARLLMVAGLLAWTGFGVARFRGYAAAQPRNPETSQPFSLSDPDGQDLILEELSARAAVHGPLSLTELEFRFRNPTSKRIEGRFTCVLPPNAAISRFAKEVNGQLMEGEVVERLRANQVYEQFLHQMRDPALLEQDQGNRFSARIFPIEANASVRILISYSALLPLRNGVRTYTLPLRGLPKVNKLTFRALVQPLPGESSSTAGSDSLTHTTADVVTMEKRDAAPDRDINLTWRPSSSAPRRTVLRAGDFFLASIRPVVPPRTAAVPHSWLLYVDTSASSAEGAEHRIEALQTLLASMPADDMVRVEAFDQDIATLGSGTAAEMSRNIAGLLRTRLFLGGTDLAALLQHAGKEAQAHPDHGVIIASDLVATLGSTQRRDIEDAARTIPAATTLHALILGSREDAAIAKSLTAGRGRVIRVPFSESLEQRAREAASDVQRPLGASLRVGEANAEWSYPTQADDVQSGDEVIVIGKSRVGQAPAPVDDELALSESTFGPLLEREGWRAYLDYLADRAANEPSDAVRNALTNERVKISVEQRVVIPETTMLVLESEWDYQRFGLDRRALAAILTVGAGGIERLDRKTNPPPPMPVAPPPPVRKDPVPQQRGDLDERRPATQPAPPPVEVPKTGGRVSEAITVTSGAPSFDNVTEALSVTASAPAVLESSAVQTTIVGPAGAMTPVQHGYFEPEPRREERPRDQPQPEAAHSDASWRKQNTTTKRDVEALQAKLKGAPSDREIYNRLSEALAATRDWAALRKLALDWQPYDPENPQVYEVLGLADEQLGNMAEAARANASIIEVAPAKPELLQRAGMLLLRDGRAALAEAPLRRALEARPDRVNGYRHLALLLWREGRVEEAARVLESAARKSFPAWYGDAHRVVLEELGYVYRAWMAKDPSKRHDIEDRAREYSVNLERRDALRVTLAWETDANDVDLHVIDPKGEECYYGHRQTKLGLELYQDITQGLGPEVIRAETLVEGTYDIGVRYFAAGPMGVSRGIVIVARGDDSIDVFPFRLLEGGGEIRYIASVNVK